MADYPPSEQSLESLVPGPNMACFRLLYAIEVGLRELLIRSIDPLGPRAWKQRLPPDVLDAFRQAIGYERGITWTSLVPHHPLYYIDFPDIRKVIDKADNWRDLFKPVFGRKGMVLECLAAIEPIRNRVAHNRLLSQADLAIVSRASQQLSSAVGPGGLSQLAMNPTVGDALPTRFAALRREAESAYELSKSYRPIHLLQWPHVQTQWWFDEDYLQHSVLSISAFFSLIDEYEALPRHRGTGHRIEAWVKSTDLDRVYRDALAEFDIILAEVRAP